MSFSLLIFSNKNNTAKLSVISQENVLRDWVSNCTVESEWTWFWKSAVQKCLTKQAFFKTQKIHMKRLQTYNYVKRDPSEGVFLWLMQKKKEFLLYTTPLDGSF